MTKSAPAGVTKLARKAGQAGDTGFAFEESGAFPYLGAVDTVAITLGPITVHWYGVMMVAGILAGIWTAGWRGRRDNLPPELFFDLIPWLIGGVVIGARALYVATYWRDDFTGTPWWHPFAFWQGGLVFHGGLVGASAATVLFARRRQVALWKLADTLAPSIALGHVLGRFGCFLNGCCYGRPTELPWAVHFPVEHKTRGLGVHPTQLYEALLDFGLYLALAWLYRRKKFDGQVFAVYLIAYACLRSVVELFRGDYTRLTAGWITPAHWVSAGLFAAGLALWSKLQRARTAGRE
jgi:phosphatidylglycerol:prolipoprotein diacylglycerol transferase